MKTKSLVASIFPIFFVFSAGVTGNYSEAIREMRVLDSKDSRSLAGENYAGIKRA
jgi:hypothetical protein